MGNQESYRRVSFENKEQENVVKVSPTVQEILKNTDDVVCPPKCTKDALNTTQETVPKVKRVSDDGDDFDDEDDAKQAEIGAALELELQKNNEYWENRIRDLQERHEKINATWEQEYEKAVNDVDEYFGKLPPQDATTPCSAERSQVLNCYKQNPTQTLMCAADVQAFYDCISRGGK